MTLGAGLAFAGVAMICVDLWTKDAITVGAVAFSLALAFFDFGGYDEGERADFALLFSVLALVALAFGYAVPRLVARFLPRR